VESVPPKETVTLELFQPFALGSGDGIPVTTGGVTSIFIITD